MSSNPDSAATQKEESFITHLVELRDRLLRVVLVVLAVFICLFPFANTLYSLLAGPLTKYLPEGSSMIATEVASTFLIPFKLVLMLSVVLAIPIIFYQAWAFVAPGLYKHERRLVMPIMFSSTVLFYVGMAFAYFVVFPLMFQFFIGAAPEGVTVMTDISRYLDFVLMIFLAFGIAFEVPIVTVVLVVLGMTTPEALGKKRPYVIVGAFVIGMVLTPPDVVSQILLAIPVWILFELGLIFSRMVVPRGDGTDAQHNIADDAQEQAVEDVPDDGASDGTDNLGDDDYQSPTDEEMEAELDALEREELEQAEQQDTLPEATDDAEGESRDDDPNAAIDDIAGRDPRKS